MASPFLQFYDFDPKLLLPSGVNNIAAANEIKSYYFNNGKTTAEKYIEVNRIVKFTLSFNC